MSERSCTSCGATIPATRSVCPACGRLQRARPLPTTSSGGAPRPAGSSNPNRQGAGSEGRAALPLARPPHRGTALAGGPARPIPRSPSALTSDPASLTAAGRRATARPTPRRGGRAALAVAAVVVLVGGAVGAWWFLRDDPTRGDLATRVERYCEQPRALDDATPFQPGQPAAAHIEVPQPESSTEPPGALTAPASPSVGDPSLDLEASIGLVSLGVCVTPTSTEATDGTCEYRLTNPTDRGEEASARLEATTFTAELYDLHSGDVLATGELTTAVDRCPEFAVLDGERVSNPLEAGVVLLWLSSVLPGGVPA